MDIVQEPFEYMVDGIKGTDRCSRCMGDGTVYGTGFFCDDCRGSGRVAWHPYKTPEPWQSQRMAGLDILAAAPEGIA